jgi:hypothetical protein
MAKPCASIWRKVRVIVSFRKDTCVPLGGQVRFPNETKSLSYDFLLVLADNVESESHKSQAYRPMGTYAV